MHTHLYTSSIKLPKSAQLKRITAPFKAAIIAIMYHRASLSSLGDVLIKRISQLNLS